MLPPLSPLSQMGVAMWMEKIRHGVLEVQTDNGLMYLRPSLGERVRLLWTFRNFQLLPQQVLKQRELSLVSTLLQRGEIQQNGECRIGTVEWPVALLEQSAPAAIQKSSPTGITTSCCPANQGNSVNSRSKRRRRKKRSQQRQSAPQVVVTSSCAAGPQ